MSKDRKFLKLPSMPSKKGIIVALLVAAAVILGLCILSNGVLGAGSGKNVEFKTLSKESIPKSIETEVIPEYRDLERALGCLVDEKVYVVVTRGEKPTSGYGVTIEKMILENKEGGSNLKVVAKFAEPEEGIAQSKVSTYPYAVALTDLTSLPDSIELTIEY